MTMKGKSIVTLSKRYIFGAVAGLLAGAVVLTACSSSGGSGSSGSTTAAAAGGSSSAAASSSAPAKPVCSTGTLNADGSTAQQNAITQWIKDYQTACSGATINYSGGGSGQGVTDFKSGKVDFAGSDAALSAADMATATTQCGSPAIDIPMVTGPVAVSFHVSGVSALTLTPKLITQIFLGTITKWNDPAIAAANSGVSLPSTPITVFFRSDSSGTTQNFETYLQATDPTDYTATPSKVWSGKVGQGKSGSQGVQQAIQGTDGAIGYLEWSYSGGQGIVNAKIDNGGGAVALTAQSAGAAVSAAQVVGTGSDLSLKLDYTTTAAGAYPLILVTYEIVCTKYADAAKGTLVKNFLTYTANGGQAGLPDLGYAPLPASILTKVQAAVAQIS
jgi:phosphate transport system substrate-binding protein